jgi:AcrR family transcriptional regulator
MRRTKEEALRTRETILQAAAQIIVRLGVTAFTIDAVAGEAGITKGGVLHHFPSKEALIDGSIDQVIESFRQRLEMELATEPEGAAGRWLRAYIRTVFSMEYGDKNLIPALAAAVAADHQIVERIRHSFESSHRSAMEDGLDPVEATIIRFAVDGIVFARALSIDVLDAEMSRNVYDALFRLTGSTASRDSHKPTQTYRGDV